MSVDIMKVLDQKIKEKLNFIDEYKIPIGVSNRHIHLSEEDLKTLYGEDHELHIKKMLKQTGQFASEETLTIRGPKGEFRNVRVLGPIRKETQVEVSLTDAFRLGITVPLRESGDLKDTPGLILEGPKGVVEIPKGCIVALRHVHMSLDDAMKFEVKNGDMIDVVVFGDRSAVLNKVIVRVHESFVLEMHLDTDEANAVSTKNDDFAIPVKFLERL